MGVLRQLDEELKAPMLRYFKSRSASLAAPLSVVSESKPAAAACAASMPQVAAASGKAHSSLVAVASPVLESTEVKASSSSCRAPVREVPEKEEARIPVREVPEKQEAVPQSLATKRPTPGLLPNSRNNAMVCRSSGLSQVQKALGSKLEKDMEEDLDPFLSDSDESDFDEELRNLTNVKKTEPPVPVKVVDVELVVRKAVGDLEVKLSCKSSDTFKEVKTMLAEQIGRLDLLSRIWLV